MNKKFIIFLMVLFSLCSSMLVFSFKERANKHEIELKEFVADHLSVNHRNLKINQIISDLPNSKIWRSFLSAHKDSYAYIDSRSGRPTSIVVSIPLILGSGVNNNSIQGTLVKAPKQNSIQITKDKMRAIAQQFIQQNTALLNIKSDEIGEIRISNPTDYLWQVFIKRQKNNISVRDSNLSLTISRGNLVLVGIMRWGDINISLNPLITSEKAVDLAFSYIGGSQKNDKFKIEPHLEIIPVLNQFWDGSLGKGYDHRLVWAFIFNRPGYINTWEFIVDANNGETLAFRDLNQYAAKKAKIVGAIYPLTNDKCCPEGCAMEQTPMPFVDTGFAYPNDFTNLGGIYRYLHGYASTTLTGKFVHVCDQCSPQPDCSEMIEGSYSGDIDLGGADLQHDCSVPSGRTLGDTFPARTSFSEVTFLNRIARSWMNNSWLDNQFVKAFTNTINTPCNASHPKNTNEIEFRKSGSDVNGSRCRNTGEILSIIDHEWAHVLDEQTANPNVSWPDPAFADTVAAYRNHDSCIGRGMVQSCNYPTPGCIPDGLPCSCDPICESWSCPTIKGGHDGWNCHGYGDCCLNCSGIRDTDYQNYLSGEPHTPLNHSCFYDCGVREHCYAIPVIEATWDFVARDLQDPPFNYDKQTAFEIGNRLLFIGIDIIDSWVSWGTCPNPDPYGGCDANNAYMQWLIADDDDANLSNGTPHMTAIYAAFNRHEIACDQPTPQNSGCLFPPPKVTGLALIPGNNEIRLSWNAQSNTSQFYIYRSEGVKGCDFGKIIIGRVPSTTTTFTDYQVLNGRRYHYFVQGIGDDDAWFGELSNCLAATPMP